MGLVSDNQLCVHVQELPTFCYNFHFSFANSMKIMFYLIYGVLLEIIRIMSNPVYCKLFEVENFHGMQN